MGNTFDQPNSATQAHVLARSGLILFLVFSNNPFDILSEEIATILDYLSGSLTVLKISSSFVGTQLIYDRHLDSYGVIRQ